MSSTEVRGYRVTCNITDKRSRPPLTIGHVIEVVAYDAKDALLQAGFEAHAQGLFDPSPDSGLELEITGIQPSLPPYSTLTGANKGPLDERLAKFLNSRSY